jgi:hypothetical protein
MRRLFIWGLLLFGLLTFCKVRAQGFNKAYDRYFAPNAIRSVVALSGNEFVMLGGGTDSLGNFGLDILRTKQNGEIIWWKTYTGPGIKRYLDGYFGNLILLPDSSLMSFGSVLYLGGEQDFCLFRFDLNGDTLFTKEWGNPGWESGAICKLAPDGNLFLAGETSTMGNSNEDLYLAKCNQQGILLWEKNFSAGKRELMLSIAVATNGDVYMSGISFLSSLSTSFSIVTKVDSSGQVCWGKVFQFPQYPALPTGGSVFLDLLNDKELILNHSFSNDNGFFVPIIQKYDSSGTMLWENATMITDKVPSSYRHVHKGNGDTLIYIGLRISDEPSQAVQHLHILRGDTAGNIFDRRIYYKKDSMGLGANSDIFASQMTSDGGLILGGHTQYYSYDHWALRLDASGCVVPNECGETPLVEVQTLLPEDKPGSIYPNPVQDILSWKAPGQMASGFSPVSRLAPFSFHDAEARPVLNIREEALARKSNIPAAENSPQNYSYTLYDIQGRNLLQGRWELQDSGVYTVVVSSFPAGCYLLMVRSDKGYFKAEKWVKD